MRPFVESISIYPIKSCKGISLPSAYAGQRGLEIGKIGDRRWMIVDDKDRLVSQRDYPSLARVQIDLLTNGCNDPQVLRVTVDGCDPLILDPIKIDDKKRDVIIHGKHAVGHDALPEGSAWFSQYLQKSMSLVYQTDTDIRLCDPDFALNPEVDTVGFADGFPYLVTSSATLLQLSEKIGSQIPMNRFRPNIVIGGAEADAEYGWQEIDTGFACFSFVKPCTRCVMTTIDQNVGEKTGKEPLATLAANYFWIENIKGKAHRGAVFGENAIPLKCGSISVGEHIEVSASRTESRPLRRLKA